MSLYYTASGSLSKRSVALAIGYGIAGGIVLGTIYGYVTQYNPFIYANMLLSAAYGVALGRLAWYAARHGRTRLPKHSALLGAMTGTLGLYCAWVSWFASLSGRAGETLWLWSPADLWPAVGIVNATGAWSMSGITPTGAWLWFVWGAEAVTVVGLAVVYPLVRAGAVPFCDACHVWTEPVFENLRYGPMEDAGGLRARLEAGQIASLDELPAATGLEQTSVALHECPSCRANGFLSVDRIAIQLTSKGETRETRAEFLPFLVVRGPALEQARALMSR